MSDYLVKKNFLQVFAILSKNETENFLFVQVQGNIIF